MLGILKVKMSLEYPTFETAFESGLIARVFVEFVHKFLEIGVTMGNMTKHIIKLT